MTATQLSLFDREDAADRAARLALSIAGVVARVRNASVGEIERARAELGELERLAGVVDAELPPVGRDISKRGDWVGFAPAHDDDQERVALACWAALGSPVEMHVDGWRAALRAPVMAQQRGLTRARRRASARTAA